MELFDCKLNLDDRPLTQTQLVDAVRAAVVLVVLAHRLSSRVRANPWVARVLNTAAGALLIGFGIVAVLLYFAPGLLTTGRIMEILQRGHQTSSQTAVRWTMLLILGLLLLSTALGFDAVLGAFVAGLIVRRYAPESLENKLIPKIEAIGFGFFIPLFFVVSGAKLDIVSIAKDPMRLLAFFALLLAIRGLPQFLLYRQVIPDTRQRSRFALYVATALPILVAITSLETANGIMLPQTAAALVGAGALSVLGFPLLGDRIGGA